jgi:hypothetical protein
MFMLVGYTKELLTRGCLQYTLTQSIGFLVVRAASFRLFGTGALGMVFCLSLWYTKSLFWALGFHAGGIGANPIFNGTPIAAC